MNRLFSPLTGVDARSRLAATGAVLVVQAVLLVWFRTRPETTPALVRVAAVGASLVVAILLAADARSYATRNPDSWWRPDWRRWAVGGVVLGINAGVFLAYLLRRREVHSNDRPSGYWKRLVVLGVVVTAVGTAVVNVYFDPERVRLGGAALLFALLNGVGFTFVAVYYDTRYVQAALSAGGSGWLFDGYHWVVLVGLPIPGRIILVILYIFRRRMLLGRIADDGEDTERLPTGEPTPSSDATDGAATAGATVDRSTSDQEGSDPDGAGGAGRGDDDGSPGGSPGAEGRGE